MNLFVGFLIFVPLVFAIALDVATIYSLIFPPGTFPNAPTGGKIGLVGVLTAISASLVYLLIRTSRSPFLDLKGAEQLPPRARQQITNFVLAATCAGPLILILAVIRVQHLRYSIGIGAGLLGLFMFSSNLIQLKYIRHLPPQERSKSEIIPVVRHAVARKRKWLIALYLIPALLAWPAFKLLSAERYISIFDLIGLLVFLGSMIFWVIVTGMADENAVPSKD